MTRETVTTALEVTGLLLLAFALGLQVSRWSLPGGIAAGGVLLLVESALLSIRPRKAAPSGDETA